MFNGTNSSNCSDRVRETNIISHTNEEIVYEYFRLIKNKDMDRLLDAFVDDAIVYESFSKTGESLGLQGKTAIGPFLDVAIMANSGLRHQIEFEKSSSNQIIAIVTFEKEKEKPDSHLN
ncbi:MAG: hypothetical protein WA323_12245 [Candidatus Nitrosopolaris sp.]